MKGPKTGKYSKSVLKKLLVKDEKLLYKSYSSDEEIEDDGLFDKSSDSDSSEEDNVRRKRQRKRKIKETNGNSIEEEYERQLENNEPVSKKMKHLLPIKTGTKLIRRMKVVDESLDAKAANETLDGDGTKDEEERIDETDVKYSERDLSEPVSTAELLAWREKALSKCRYKIGVLSSSILENPQQNILKLKQLNEMLNEYRPELAVSVKKLVSVSLTEIFKDIVPLYQIKHQEATGVKLKKETERLQSYEKSLLKQYRLFLKAMEKLTSLLVKKKGDTRVISQQTLGLSLVALNCLCDLLVTHPYFNYAANIAKVIIVYMNNPRVNVRTMVANCIKKVFEEDKRGEITLFIVRQINQFVKSRKNAVQSEVVSVFLSLKLKDVNLDQKKEDEIEDKKMNAKRQRLLTMSRKEKKAKKKLKQLEQELLEMKGEESKQNKQKLLTEVTKAVFTVYFRILKNSPTSNLLCTTLEGIAKFAHTINLEFYEDLVHVLCRLMDGGELALREQLLCIQAVFTILSGYGESMNVDPTKFYTHLYRNMLSVHAGSTYGEIELILNTLDTIVIKRRKRITQQRLLSFTKRITMLAMQLLHNGSLGCLGLVKNIFQLNKFVDILLEMDSSVGQGVYLPELDEPEHCNAGSTSLYELTALRRHYHPTVCKLADHIIMNVPTTGEGTLPADIGKLSHSDFLKEFNPLQMSFKPTIPAPKAVKFKLKPHIWHNRELEALSERTMSNDISLKKMNIFEEVNGNISDIKFEYDSDET